MTKLGHWTHAKRQGNGQFRKTTLADFGIANSQINSDFMACDNCGYGTDEEWMPVLLTGICPKCGSRDKRLKHEPQEEAGQ
jgi:ssDNA-binding Zn-finger/Zn-ribbon topoisomerase 1